MANQNKDRQARRVNKHRPEQARLLEWQLALSDIAAEWGDGKYRSMKPVPFRDAEHNRMIYLNEVHFLVWSVLVKLAYDLSKDFTNVLHSYGEIAHYCGISQNKVEAALDVLEDAVRIIATNRRGKNQTNQTWIFMTPLEPGETWQKRTGVRESAAAKSVGHQQQTTAKTASGERATSKQEVQLVAQAFGAAFGQIAAFQSPKTKDSFMRGIPRMIEQAGSAERLVDMFGLIQTDDTRDGLKLKAQMQAVASPVEYLKKALPDWFARYEPYQEPESDDDRNQPFDEEYENDPYRAPSPW